MTKQDELIKRFNIENDGSIYIDYVKNILPRAQDVKKAFEDYCNYVNTIHFKKINGLYTDNKGANYLIDSVFNPLSKVNLFDLDTMQREAETYKNKKQLLNNVFVMCQDAISNINKYNNCLVIEGTTELIYNPKNIINLNSSNTVNFLLDEFLKDKFIHPQKEVFNKVASFKKQYEQLEKA